MAELLLATDVLISDYSALLADHAVTGRPVLLYVPDLAEFETSPGLNIDLATDAPGPRLRTSQEVVEALADIVTVTAGTSRRPSGSPPRTPAATTADPHPGGRLAGHQRALTSRCRCVTTATIVAWHDLHPAR